MTDTNFVLRIDTSEVSSLCIGMNSFDSDGAPKCGSDDIIWTARMVRNLGTFGGDENIPGVSFESLLLDSDLSLVDLKDYTNFGIVDDSRASDRSVSGTTSQTRAIDSRGSANEPGVPERENSTIDPQSLYMSRPERDASNLSANVDQTVEPTAPDRSKHDGCEYEVSETNGSGVSVTNIDFSLLEEAPKNDGDITIDASYIESEGDDSDSDNSDGDSGIEPMSDAMYPPLPVSSKRVSEINPDLVDVFGVIKAGSLLERIYNTRDEHRRQIRTLLALSGPLQESNEIRELLRIANIPGHTLEVPPIMPNELPTFKPAKNTSKNSSKNALLWNPLTSTFPELYVSAGLREDLPTGEMFDTLPFADTNNATAERMLQAHISRLRAGGKPCESTSIFYPLGYVPVDRWESFSDVFGENFADIAFELETFVRVPEGFGDDPDIKSSRDSASDPAELADEFELNRYDPVYARSTDDGQDSYCGTCEMWFKRNKSNWLHHMKSIHGVRSRTHMSFSLPHIVARKPQKQLSVKSNRRSSAMEYMYIGYCDDCQSWQTINHHGSHATLSSWYLHASSHDVARNRRKPNVKPRKEQVTSCLARHQLDYALEAYYNRRRTLVNVQHVLRDYLAMEGGREQLCKSPFFQNSANFWVYDPESVTSLD